MIVLRQEQGAGGKFGGGGGAEGANSGFVGGGFGTSSDFVYCLSRSLILFFSNSFILSSRILILAAY